MRELSGSAMSRACMLLANTKEGLHSTLFTRTKWTQKRSSFASSVSCKFAPFQGLFQVPVHELLLGLVTTSSNIRKHKTQHCRCCDTGAPSDTSLSPEESTTSTDNSIASGLQKPSDAASLDFERRVESRDAHFDDAHPQLPDQPSHNANKQLSNQEVELENKGMLQQMREIIMFAGPALGIWLSGPIMSLIDTAVVGNSSSLELAALGPGTVFCDQVGYLFMFLSVATSNLIATSLAKKGKDEAAHHLSRLLFISLVCGICMLILTGAFSPILLKGFVGPQNESLVPAACSYVQIRGLAWPAVLVGLVAQSASLGMKDAWGPLKALVIASFLNLSGDILFCTYLGYGIAGAAWATMISQWVGGYFMLKSLSAKGYNPLALSIPSFEDLSFILKLAAPVLLTVFSKVAFFSLVTYALTALGAVTLAAHQVMVQLFMTCSVSAEPMAQTAQAFMPALIQGSRRNVKKAQMLLRSLMVIGAFSGTLLGALGICCPWFFPQVFTDDAAVIIQMREITLPFLWSLVVTGPLLSLEGTLLAGRDLKFLSLSMVACFVAGSSLLTVCNRMEWGFQGIWWTVACFQTIRFCVALNRLTSKNSVIRDSQEDKPVSMHWKLS